MKHYRGLLTSDRILLMKPCGFIASLALLVWVADSHVAIAQSMPPRLEVGMQASFLRLSDLESTNAGFGGRFSFDLADWAALEAEADFFPHDGAVVPSSGLTPDLRVAYQRRRTDAFFGVKLGRRGDKFGMFGKVRPGFTRLYDSGLECVGEMCALVLLARPDYRTEFALDLGGVLEFYPSVRTVMRFEVGDIMIGTMGASRPRATDRAARATTFRRGPESASGSECQTKVRGLSIRNSLFESVADKAMRQPPHTPRQPGKRNIPADAPANPANPVRRRRRGGACISRIRRRRSRP